MSSESRARKRRAKQLKAFHEDLSLKTKLRNPKYGSNWLEGKKHKKPKK